MESWKVCVKFNITISQTVSTCEWAFGGGCELAENGFSCHSSLAEIKPPAVSNHI